MAIPRKDSTIPERVKKLEQELRRIRLLPSLSQSAVAPLSVKGSGWFDSSAGNEPKVFDGQNWVPVRDETIAVAQGTADTAQSTAVSAAADAATAVAVTGTLQTDLDNLNDVTLPALQTQVNAILPITETDISDDAITTPKIAANAVTAAEIAALAVTTAKLDAGAVTAAKIAAGTITANEIAANAVTATQIAAGAIDGKTITGSLIRTAATSTRVEIDSVNQNQARFFTGHASETVPGAVLSVLNPAGVGTQGAIKIKAPTIGGSPESSLTLAGDSGVDSFAKMVANDIVMLADDDVTIQAADFTQLISMGASGVKLLAASGPIALVTSSGGPLTFNGDAVATVTPPTGWTALPLVNSWVDVAGARAGYMKDGTGRVSLRGQISGGSSGGLATIATLPSGFRPSQTMEWIMRGVGGVLMCAVQVATTGVMTVTANGGTANSPGIKIDSITFPTN